MIDAPPAVGEFRATAEQLRAQHKIKIAGDAGVVEKFDVKAEYDCAGGVLAPGCDDKHS